MKRKFGKQGGRSGTAGTRARRAAWMIGAIAFAALLDGCGGDTSSAGACAISGCGGDIEGTWDVTDMCVKPSTKNLMTSIPACDSVAAAALGSAKIEPAGVTVTFMGGSYTESGTAHVQAHYEYTNDCLTAQQGNPASDTMCSEVQTNLANAGFQGKCSFSRQMCLCDVTQDVAVNESGTYRVDGTTLRFDADTTGSPYCVHGDSAQVSTPGGASFSGSFTMTRKK